MERDKPPVGPTKTAYAKQQRENASDAERRLWSILRRKQIKGQRFSRREAIGPYLVDFYCPGAKLVIELDDGLPDTARALDAQTQWLTSQGYQVARLKVEDVRRRPWPTVNQLARKFRLRDIPRIISLDGPSNQS